MLTVGEEREVIASLAEARNVIATVREALEGCIEYLGSPQATPTTSWGLLDHGAEAERKTTVRQADAALAYLCRYLGIEDRA